MRRAVFTFFSSAVAFVFLLNTLAVFAQAPAQPPPTQWTRSRDYDVQHYRIKVSFDWTEKSVTGETTITFKPFTDDLKEVEIDAGEMTITAVNSALGAPLTFRYVNDQKLHVTLDKACKAGQPVAITINYKATPKRGITFITPDETDKTRPYQIWSQGEAQDNHYWFPCYDYPNDRATSELFATVEDRFQVISNGRLVSVRRDAAKKTKTYHWRMEQPFSSYLVSIIVGEYAEVRDRYRNIPVSSFVYKDQVENARASFGKLARMVEFFSKKVGYEYPFVKYAQTMVRDFSGAMENITATTMTDTAVHDRRALLDSSPDSLVAHELAHSWFGNLVTCRDWGELWLNEAFASFMETVWSEHDKGRDTALYETYQNQQGYFQAWDQGYRRPMVTKLYADPDGLFDAYVYPRGAAVVQMLRFVLGDGRFWKAVNHYLKKHRWQNVETQQLVVAIEEATGQNLQWFFDQWLYRMGHPEFDIAASYDEAAKSLRLTVRQTQKPDEERRWYASAGVFTMPVDLAITTATGEKVHRLRVDDREETFTFAVDSKPLIINFDRGNHIIKRVKFERTDEDLAYQLLHDNDVMGRVRAAIEMRDRKSDIAMRALAEAAAKDPFYAVRLEAAQGLAQLQGETARAALVAAARDRDARVRRAAIQGLAEFKDAQLADLFINLMSTDQSYAVVAEAAKALGLSGSPKAFDALLAALKMDSWQESVRAAALSGLAGLKDPRGFDIALRYAAPGNSPAVRAAALALLGETATGKQGAFEALAAALKEPSLQVKFNAIAGLVALGDPRAVPLLEELARQPGLPSQLSQYIAAAAANLKERGNAGRKP